MIIKFKKKGKTVGRPSKMEKALNDLAKFDYEQMGGEQKIHNHLLELMLNGKAEIGFIIKDGYEKNAD